MGTFNYSNIHIFDKNGRELPLVIKSSYKIEIPNKKGKAAVFYPILNTDGTLSFYKESSGNRFDNSSSSVKCKINDSNAYAEVEYSAYSAIDPDSQNSAITEYSISNILSINTDQFDSLSFPCATLSSYINFNPVSTELVETESLYVFVKNDNGEYVPINDFDNSFGTRYELLFYIDTTSQSDFRFFNIENEDVVWTDKTILDLSSSEENGYRVNIGFCAEEEGIFKETLHICLLDRGKNKSISLNECDIIPIGTISLNAESIGEDERYRTLFTNFGIPDPKTYNDIFANTSIDEDKIDNILLNQNSKKLFLTYSEIFPYAGTYKALINAIKVLGYDDLFFKEWYKRTGKLKNTGYISYDITYNSDTNANIINNVSLEERIHLKKLNWLSMIYKLNEEIKSSADDQYGFPEVINKYNYHNTELVVKLISLRDWLQKYIIGLNCKIIDVGGEGIYFERYKLGYYSTYQTLYDYNNECNLAPYIVDDTNKNILVDCSTDILVNVGTDDSKVTFEELSDKKFIDFCEGYFDSSSAYHIGQEFKSEEDILIGKTLFAFTDVERYKIKAEVSCKDYMLSYDNNIENDTFLDSSSASLIITDNSLIINPLDIHNGQGSYANFEELPIIAVKTAQIFEELPKDASDNILDWAEVEHENYEFEDYILLYPDDESSLIYCEESVHGLPVFKIKGYTINENIDSSLNSTDEYIFNIIDCKFISNLSTNNHDKTVVINFENENAKKLITVNTTYYSDEFFTKEYISDASKPATENTEYNRYHFREGEIDTDFINRYNISPEECVKYNFVSSIKVNTAGEYKVDVIGFDLYNNMFAATCKNTISIRTPQYETSTITNFVSDSSVTDDVVSYVKDNYINYCIYKKEYNIPFTKNESDKNKTAIEYNNLLAVNEIKKNDYIHFSNKIEKFDVVSVDDVGSTTSAKNYDEDDVIDVYTGYNLTVKPAYTEIYPKYKFNAVPESITQHSTDMFNNTESDINIIFYNELGGYPIYQTYGTICTAGNNEYKIQIPDDSIQEYVWADAKSLGPNLIAKELTNTTFVILNMYEGSDWEVLPDAQNIIYDCYTHFIHKIFDNYIYPLDGIDVDKSALADYGMTDDINTYTQQNISNFLHTSEKSPINLIDDSTSCRCNYYNFLHYFVTDNIFNEMHITELDVNASKYVTEKRTTFKSAYIRYNYKDIIAYLVEVISSDYAVDSSYGDLVQLSTEIVNELIANNITLFRDFVIEPELFELLKTAIAKYVIDVVQTDRNPSQNLSNYIIKEFNEVFSITSIDLPSNVDTLLRGTDAFVNVCNAIKDTINDSNYSYTYKLCTVLVYIYLGYYIIDNNDYEESTLTEFFSKFAQGGDPGLSIDILVNASRIAIANYFEYIISFSEDLYPGANSILSINELDTLLEDLSGRGAKGMLIPYKYKLNNNLETYNQYGSRLLKYVFSKEFEEMTKTTGWITTDKLPSSDNVNQLFYYAVAYKRDDTVYYLKTTSMGSGGYPTVTTDLAANYTFNLAVLATKPEIGIYVEPISKIQVLLNRVDPRTYLDDESIEKPSQVLPSNQLAVHITSSEEILLNRGDNVKLIFKNAFINEYFGQSSYKVIDIDEQHTWVIIEGNINNEYIRELGNYVTYSPSPETACNFTGYNETSQQQISIKTWRDMTTYLNTLTVNVENKCRHDYILGKLTVQETNGETGESMQVQYTTVTVYEDGKEQFKAVLFNTEWRILVSSKKSEQSSIYHPRMYEEGNTTLDIYISYAHTAYVDYVLPSNSYSYNTGTINDAIDIINTNDTLKYLDFIDSKFMMSSREFDSNEGISSWMDLLNPVQSIRNPFGGSPQILRKNIYLHEHDLPVLTQDEPNLVYCIRNGNEFGLPDGYYAYWKVYKHSNTDTGKKYMFDSYNPALYLDCNEPGIYDIELYVYDKFGNISIRKIDGAFKVF